MHYLQTRQYLQYLDLPQLLLQLSQLGSPLGQLSQHTPLTFPQIGDLLLLLRVNPPECHLLYAGTCPLALALPRLALPHLRVGSPAQMYLGEVQTRSWSWARTLVTFRLGKGCDQ